MVPTTRCHKGKSGKICKALKSHHRNTMFSMVNPPCTWCRLSHRVNNAKYPKYCSGKGVHRTDVQFFFCCDLRLWSFWFWMSIKGIFLVFVIHCRIASDRIKAGSGVPTLFLVNVGQSSDGRVSSVEPAVLIHIAVLQMARTVNWECPGCSPWCSHNNIRTEPTQLPRWRLSEAAPLSLLYSWRVLHAKFKSAALLKESFYLFIYSFEHPSSPSSSARDAGRFVTWG